jgi:hypothetical protein
VLEVLCSFFVVYLQTILQYICVQILRGLRYDLCFVFVSAVLRCALKMELSLSVITRLIYLLSSLALSYLHAAGVIHRDLKPSNMCVLHCQYRTKSLSPLVLFLFKSHLQHSLVGQDCDVHICDFGLARRETDRLLSMYIVTRWYRPPEVLLCKRQYNKAVDIWSAGCIFAELVMQPSPTRQGLFPGHSYKDQTDKIIRVTRVCITLQFAYCSCAFQMLGAPSEDDLASVCDNRCARCLRIFFKTHSRLLCTPTVMLLNTFARILCRLRYSKTAYCSTYVRMQDLVYLAIC